MDPHRDWHDDLALIRDAARGAARIALGFFGRAPEVWWKNDGRSPVSAADFAADAHLRDVLMAARPDYGWLSEEGDRDPARLSRQTLFVVDPIDGTRGFLAGEKVWCVSVAVVSAGRPVAGVLVAPALEEEFSAVAGGAALKNGEPLLLAEKAPDATLVMAGEESLIARLGVTSGRQVRRVGRIPSLAYRLAMVADGRLDGTVVRPNSHDWDIAAADLILERAGGRLHDHGGRRLAYNRADVRHDMLVAGSNLALGYLEPLLSRS